MGIDDVLKGAAFGAAFEEGPKQVVELVSKALKFRATRRDLEDAVHRAIPVAQEMKRLNQELDHPEEEVTWLLEDALKSLTRSNILLMPTMARDVQKTLLMVRNGIQGKQLKSRFKPPPKPDLVVGIGFDNPLSLFNRLKNQLLQTGTSLLVLTGLAGYGKTTLATLLCWDDHVRGKFGQNILFLTVSKSPNLKTIVQSLYQHYGLVVPDLDLAGDRRTLSHLKNLPEEIMRNPTMLVLDDVWPDSHHLIDAFKVQQLSDYKILVTSRFNLPGFEPVYRMEPLCLQDSVTLLRRLALPNDGPSTLSNYDYEEKRGLTQQRQKRKKLSKGRPIIESHTELSSILKKYLDDGLEDKPIIKECFMDLGLFPEDQKIPVAALIDIWTERLNKPDDDHRTQKLKEADALNIVYDLTDRHLAKLVVRSYVSLLASNFFSSIREAGIDLHDYSNHHFLMQHDLMREMVEASQEPYRQRKRLMFDTNEKNWSQHNQQNTVARTLSISTCNIFTPEWDDIVKAEVVEVLVLNLRTKKYTLPEFTRKMKELKPEKNQVGTCSVTTFGKWHNLRKFSLYNCNIREAFESDSISISEALPNLVELCVDYCKDLVKLPPGLCDITSIKKLSITRCMRFIALPQDIGNLKNLKILRLSSCAVFEEIPASITKLLQLRFLDISGCVSLRNLPGEIGNLRNLERLYMIGCSSCKMPCSITQLESLEYVRCDEETATTWKEEFKPSLPNLKIEETNHHSLFIFYNSM
ncbi:hypothetical protein VNO78_26718 [Psophocarpus tetragonolobus]|uniref:Uncharacterized protein n=1 Tax=Psophocarpus tetragonolobus TaxID=3891 RepID=A0AAN9S0L4_PSOTE